VTRQGTSTGTPVKPAGRRPILLVLDDQQEVTVLVARWLSDVADVHTATTSAQASTLANVIEPDLAIIDIIMPRVDGLELVAALRRNPRLSRMRVIFITGSDRVDIPLRAAEVGAMILYKPLQEEKLRNTVLSVLAGEVQGA
jgi:PleD family two-component response regulator